MAELSDFCSQRMEKLAECFPLCERKKDSKDPGLIYDDKEWKAELLQDGLKKKRDAIFLWGCCPDNKCFVQVFFERLDKRLATYSIILDRGDQGTLSVDTQVHVDCSAGNVLGAGSLRLECDAPMRMWRMIYNGIMKDTKTNAEVHARIACRFSSMSHTFEYPKHVPASDLAKALCDSGTEELRKQRIASVTSDLCGHEQAVTFYMETTIGDDYKTFMLFGSKLRLIGDRTLFERCNKQVFVYVNNGTVAHCVQLNEEDCFGFGFNSTSFIKALDSAKWNSTSLQFSLESHKYDLSLEEATKITSTQLAEDLIHKSCTRFVGKTFINKKDFKFYILEVQIPKVLTPDKTQLNALRFAKPKKATFTPLVVTTEMDICAVETLTGTKGRSVAVLSAIAIELKTFIIPRAVVLTTAAHEVFLSQPECQEILQKYQENLKNRSNLTEFNSAVDKCIEELSEVCLPADLSQALAGCLEVIFGRIDETKQFAVRPSLIEDKLMHLRSEPFSFPKLPAFLCVKGFEAICNCVIKCWAAHYFYSVHGTYMKSMPVEMAVVVQEMVPADKAGIMFTCDPVTDNPNIITITANYGLGESVVSGLVEGDSVVVDATACMKILERKVGSKSTMIVECQDGGTEEQDISPELAEEMCVADDMVIRLAKLATELTKLLDGPQNTEWAIHGDLIYLLQCRPVTTQFRASDFEITHDLSTSLYTNREMLFNSNELLPGNLTPLTLCIISTTLFNSFSAKVSSSHVSHLFNTSPYSNQLVSVISRELFANISNWLPCCGHLFSNRKMKHFGVNMMEVSSSRRGIRHDKIIGLSEQRNMIALFYKFHSYREKITEKSDQFKITLDENADSQSMFLTIVNNIHLIGESLVNYLRASVNSVLHKKMCYKVLKSSQDSVGHMQLMALLSKLLTNADGTEVLRDFMELSKSISKFDSDAEVTTKSPEEALKFLQEDEGAIGESFAKFMKKHGFRGYHESDLSFNTWSSDPIPLIRMLQRIVPYAVESTTDDTPFAVAQLPKRPSWIHGKLLQLCVHKAKNSIQYTNITKAYFLQCFDEIRRKVNLLGHKMVDEGRIPDAGLIHFFTIDEISRLMDTGCPMIICKAMRRRDLHGHSDRIASSLFKNLSSKTPEGDNAGSRFKVVNGCAASPGVAVGPARVIHNYEEEAHLICKGDILITHATDIGWAPCFSLLGGVVTEIGGVFSSGAVAARAYGVPGVTCASGVTQQVNNGDTVRIDGTAGTLTLIKESDGVDLTPIEVNGMNSDCEQIIQSP